MVLIPALLDYIRISLELIYSLFTDEVEAGECVLNEVTSVDTVLGPGSSVSPEISDVGKASSGEVLDIAVEKYRDITLLFQYMREMSTDLCPIYIGFWRRRNC